MLLAAGADARVMRPDRMTALHMAVLGIVKSPDGPGKDVTLALLRAGADPNAWDKDSGLQGSPFHLLVAARADPDREYHQKNNSRDTRGIRQDFRGVLGYSRYYSRVRRRREARGDAGNRAGGRRGGRVVH
jgi:hypothetical protein